MSEPSIGWHVLKGKNTGLYMEVYFDGTDMYWLNVADPMECEVPLKAVMMKVSNWRDGVIVQSHGLQYQADTEL